jgi:peptidoglycan/xylan/chitin deacetylase (PgdA/CDA1 family)
MAALAFCIALLALSVIVAASGGHPESSFAASSPTPTTPGSHTTPTEPSPVKVAPRLFRIVGCLSTRSGAVRGGPPRREVAFGFDDGPWTETPEFVRMLERAGVRATFFMIGRQVTAAYRPMLLRELRDGDVLGDHTWSHPDLTRSSEARSQLLRTLEVIRGLTGYTPCVFRPPYGAYDTSVLRTARSLGLATVLWNVDPADWAEPGTGAILQRVLAQVRPGSIVISHDGGGTRSQTLAAYPEIIRTLRSRGYRIVTVLELLGFRPVYVPCIRLCDGLGLKRAELPRHAIIRPAP